MGLLGDIEDETPLLEGLGGSLITLGETALATG
jgi:hypothetical protein